MPPMNERLRFLGAFLRNRRHTGSVVPSSRFLAKRMVDAVGPLAADDFLVELGPGTGVFTKRLAEMYPANRILAIELHEGMAESLSSRFPKLNIVCGCASKLPEHCRKLGLHPSRIHAVVSGLPMLSLPVDARERIFQTLCDTLPSGARYVQFTYSRRSWERIQLPGFRLLQHKKVLLNFPPATVLPFERI